MRLPVQRRPLSAFEIGVGHALSPAARCRRSTFIHRCITARDGAASDTVYLHANREVWIVGLRLRRRAAKIPPITRIHVRWLMRSLRVKCDPFANLAGRLRVTTAAISCPAAWSALSRRSLGDRGTPSPGVGPHPKLISLRASISPLTAPANPRKFADLRPARVVAAASRLS
jgi:hypothetical protein